MTGKVNKPRFVVGGRTLTSEEILALIAKGSDETAKLAGGVKVEADPRLLDVIQKTPLGQYVGDDGDIDVSAMTGVEEMIAAQIVAAAVGFLIGLGAGLALGSGDGGGANGEGESDGEGEDGEGRNGGDSEGNGGDSEGNGGE